MPSLPLLSLAVLALAGGIAQADHSTNCWSSGAPYSTCTDKVLPKTMCEGIFTPGAARSSCVCSTLSQMSSCYVENCDKTDFFTMYPRATSCVGMTPPAAAATPTVTGDGAVTTDAPATGTGTGVTPTATAGDVKATSTSSKNAAAPAATGLIAGADALYLSVGAALGLGVLVGVVVG
ncbi:hypothetical protein B0T19DRAFT_443536 [Cercophora scortea]|uniref:Extracellular membrane protein CFEM domain-containing protein n=1 Tax=Cercophora scortea TaxID=314031 RepID=A0AAE0IFH8_9PEZI|nr:hypothetical protein B0T19DRAFT_443536 [Cercophora scortea]